MNIHEKKLMLHIAMGKTGTSALQDSFWEKRKALEKDGSCCPTCGVVSHAHHLLSPAVRSDSIQRSSAIGGAERRSLRLCLRPRCRSQSPQLTQKHHMLNANRKYVDDRTICVHGNFSPLKYRFFESSMGKRYIMWMQNLVGRLLAHDVFWKDNS